MNPDVVLELARMSDIFVPKLAEYFYDPTDRPPAKLYHYTSLDTLGLMLTKRLSSTDDFTFSSWMAGSCLTQNDSQEYGIAGKAFRKYLKINDPGLYESYCKSRDIYWPYIGAHALRAIEKTYAICFSKREDDLSQWLAYGDKGRGVFWKLIQAFYGISWKRRDWPLQTYSTGRKRFQKIWTWSLVYVISFTSPTQQVLRQSYQGIVFHWLFLMAYLHVTGCKSKSSHFKNEAEWRIVFHDWGHNESSDIKEFPKVWNHDGFLKSGTVVDLKSNRPLVTKIILGPLCNHPGNIQTIEALIMNMAKVAGTPVIKSRVPFAG